jgi:hypothetical protein
MPASFGNRRGQRGGAGGVNLWLFPQDFSQVNWVASGVTKVGVAGVSDPNGGSNAYEISFAGADAILLQTVVGIAPGTYTLSMYVRAKAGSTTVRLNFADDSIHRYSADSTVTDAGWTRLTHTVATGAITGSNYPGIATNTTANSAAVYIFGGKLEVGPVATAYRP